MNERFERWADAIAKATGSAWAFIVACLTIIIWGVTGPFFHFSDTWQLVINTSTTIITFLMVFLIQAAQNKSDAATHLKLDELLRAVHDAHNDIIDAEDMTESEIKRRKQHLKRAISSQ